MMELTRQPSAEPRFDNRLQCYVHTVFYDFDAKYGRLHMGENSCCDMTACIDLFVKIDAECTLILTFTNDGMPDTEYRRIRGTWQAVDWRYEKRLKGT